jgi:hypothetical protein
MSSFESEEVIEDRIASLRSELNSYSTDVVNLIQAIYGKHNLGPKYDLKNSPFQMVTILKQEVVELLRQSDGHANFLAQHQGDIVYCKNLSDVLSRVAGIVEHFNEFENSMNTLKLASCCRELGIINAELCALPATTSLMGGGKVLSCLRNEQKLLRCRLVAKLKRLLSEAISFDYGSIIVQKRLSGYLRSEDRVVEEGIDLVDVWQALVASDSIEQVLDAQLQDIWNFVFIPMWKEKKNQGPNINTSIERGEFQLGSLARGNTDWSHIDNDRGMTIVISLWS